MDNFSKEKQDFLNKVDKSTKGSWDAEILELLNLINTFDCYYTTSSCSGRIVLLDCQDKKESEWLFVSHDLVKSLKIPKKCWFLQESPIIHIRCKSLEDAEKLIEIANKSGLKRAGIISVKNLTVEIRGTERIETIVESSLPADYINSLIEEGNRKLLKSRAVFNRFLENLKKQKN